LCIPRSAVCQYVLSTEGFLASAWPRIQGTPPRLGRDIGFAASGVSAYVCRYRRLAGSELVRVAFRISASRPDPLTDTVQQGSLKGRADPFLRRWSGWIPGSVGLGLAIAHLLTSRTGGTIAYRREGATSVFAVTYPLASRFMDETVNSEAPIVQERGAAADIDSLPNADHAGPLNAPGPPNR
jgi:hypothetical protein